MSLISESSSIGITNILIFSHSSHSQKLDRVYTMQAVIRQVFATALALFLTLTSADLTADQLVATIHEIKVKYDAVNNKASGVNFLDGLIFGLTGSGALLVRAIEPSPSLEANAADSRKDTQTLYVSIARDIQAIIEALADPQQRFIGTGDGEAIYNALNTVSLFV